MKKDLDRFYPKMFTYNGEPYYEVYDFKEYRVLGTSSDWFVAFIRFMCAIFGKDIVIDFIVA